MANHKRKKGRSAKAAKRGLLGLPKKERKRVDKFTKLHDKREAKVTEKRDAAALRAKVTGQVAEPEENKIPRSMIFHMGSVGLRIKKLERNIRKVMLPYTASDLQVKKQNVFKDFLTVAGPIGVTHLMTFTKSDLSVNLRLLRLPQGPTLHFKGSPNKLMIDNYLLANEILSKAKRPVYYQKLFASSPLVIMNGFGNSKKRHLELVQTVVENMFPTINVDTVKLQNIKRAVLFSHDPETDNIEFRHYSIKTVPCDVSKSTKKLMQNRKIPDLSRYKDISEFLLKPGHLSESEFEGEQEELELPQDMSSRGCQKGTKTKLRLCEIGPRLTLKLVKIEAGVDKGDVLYHAHHSDANARSTKPE
ncbi:Brix domain-containing protein [Aphelenchoides bicaudatus]|nr:Brix domain-containing protein [Aphelenchoides bicaudatus]